MYLCGEKIVTPLSKVTYMILDSLVIETAKSPKTFGSTQVCSSFPVWKKLDRKHAHMVQNGIGALPVIINLPERSLKVMKS